MNTITRQAIEKGYKNGIITLTNDGFNRETVAKIGDIWFYFGCSLEEILNAEEYIKQIPEETIINEIFLAIEDFKENSEFEYNHYFYILCENGCI